MKAQLRIAMRVEDGMWKAYLAACDKMDEAVLMGTIAMGIVERNEQIKHAFVDLMKQSLVCALEDVEDVGVAGWEEKPAKELD